MGEWVGDGALSELGAGMLVRQTEGAEQEPGQEDSRGLASSTPPFPMKQSQGSQIGIWSIIVCRGAWVKHI